MENAEHWVFECNVEIKSEPDDFSDEFNETDTFCNTGTEPSTSNAVQHDKSTLPYHSFNHKIEEKELEIPSEQDYHMSDNSSFSPDQVALNSDIDYRKILEGIYFFETQRVQAIKDLDELYELQEQALSDPIAFLEKLQNHNVKFSASSKTYELPAIDWSRYELFFNASRVRRQQTKLADKISDLINCACEKDDSLCPIETPKQRYQLWTAEEQKKLEELLIKFPAENVENDRYKKIADCLENRTFGQVAGRVKQYFKMLKKHRISVKEGIPTTDYIKKPCSCVIGPKPSTLLVSHQPPIYKPDGSEGKSNFFFNHRRKLIKHNFYHFWTNEEQKKLDDLLIRFPPEEDESSRWEKISEHLENRSPRQVATRVKYLKWLMQNGKFVPGKIPGIQFNEVASADFRYSHGSNIMQYWTPEEHQRLEELLIQFPPEKHEFQRWRKIANCLGNRTPVQVGARAKNYFISLKRYGMPVPGRLPKTIRRLKTRRIRKCRTVYPTTFLDSHPSSSTVENSMDSEMDRFGEKDINQELDQMEKALEEKQNSSALAHIGYKGEKDINQELDQMEKALKEKQNSSALAHIGYKCSRCQVEPIMGVRWHCTVCNTKSVDFCSDCCASEYKELDGHSFDHTLEAIQGVTH